MDLLKALLAALGLPETASQDEALAELSKKMKTLSDMREKVGAKPGDDDTAALAACSALVARQADPAQFVPLATFEAVKGQVAALTASQRDREVNELVGTALANAQLLPAQEAWARDLGRSDPDKLKAYLAQTPAIAALTSTQTQGKSPASEGGGALSVDELAVCSATGVTPEAFLKAKV